MNGKKIIVFILIMNIFFILIASSGFNLASAEEYEKMEYNDFFKTVVFRQAGKNFAQPEPMFRVESSDGQMFSTISPNKVLYDNYKGYSSKNMPINMTVPIGTKINLRDTSAPGEGDKISLWDWQIYYRDNNNKDYENGIIFKRTKDVNDIVADKEGYIYIFLNVADNYILKTPSGQKILGFSNWSNKGIWRTGGTAIQGNVQILDWYFNVVKIKVGGKSNMVMRELELIDPETGQVLESFKREVDNLDPMNISKQKIVWTNKSPYKASVLKRDKTYKVRAKYQFISFAEGSFDISNPWIMTNEQRSISTKVSPNKLIRTYSYDENWNKSGVYDEIGEELSIDKPWVELRNLEGASFEWDYKIPEEVEKYIKISGIVPEVFANNDADTIPQDNWAVVYARVTPNDLGMYNNVKLINENGEIIKNYRKDSYLRLIFPVEHVDGEDIVGTHPIDNPKVFINIEVRDENNEIIFTQKKLQTDKELKPKEIIDMPISNKFKTNSSKITACATINTGTRIKE